MSSTYDYGPLVTFEVTWMNGHVERIEGHQCLTPRSGDLFGERSPVKPRWTIHGEFDGRWRLVLSALDEDIRTVRNLSHEDVPS